MHEDRS